MSAIPTRQALGEALSAAASGHHEYEQAILSGVYDEQWPGWYAAYVLGRLGDFTLPSNLTKWLQAATADGPWAPAAAAYVLDRLGRL